MAIGDADARGACACAYNGSAGRLSTTGWGTFKNRRLRARLSDGDDSHSRNTGTHRDAKTLRLWSALARRRFGITVKSSLSQAYQSAVGPAHSKVYQSKDHG